MKIDSHQHFWKPGRGDYDWMPKDSVTLNRDWLPDDLSPALDAAGMDGTVVVQAAATVAETDFLLGLADASPRIKGVVGWIDFEDPSHRRHLERLALHPAFRGVRPMIQDIPDPDWMLRDDVQWAYQALIDLDLTFDALGFPEHIQNFLTLADRYPDLRIVFDHGLKPQISRQRAGTDVFSEWAKGMSRLARETSGVCKLSGLVTEAGDGWKATDIAPFARHILEAFGPERVMWGSDWPVCNLQCDYGAWHALSGEFARHLDPFEQAELAGGTAARFYRLT